jgi:hypothetical protein
VPASKYNQISSSTKKIMGVDRYEFKTASVYGILIAWKDLVPDGCTLWENQDGWVERLCSDVRSSSDGIRTFNALDRFLLLSKDEDVYQAPKIDFYGPSDDPTICVTATRSLTAKGDEAADSLLVEAALRITPEKQLQLRFAPGLWMFAWTEYSEIKEISPITEEGQKKQANNVEGKFQSIVNGQVPTNLDLVVGTGTNMEKISVNRDILCSQHPALDKIFWETSALVLEFPNLMPSAVKHWLHRLCSRDGSVLDLSPRPSHEDIKKVKSTWNISSSAQKKRKAQTLTGDEESYLAVHPSLSEKRFFDCSFLIGENPSVTIQGNRAILGSMNAVLHSILYGTGSVSAHDNSQPIVWTEFDPEAVRTVLQALAHCTKKNICIPWGQLKEAIRFADYIGESAASLKLVLNYARETANGIQDMGADEYRYADKWFMGSCEEYGYTNERDIGSDDEGASSGENDE